ncbi:MAG TPA: hypothetical protein PKN28_05690 [Clostridiales bacterium]|nr:hypothetical protein [Clostridiales bacterium]
MTDFDIEHIINTLKTSVRTPTLYVRTILLPMNTGHIDFFKLKLRDSVITYMLGSAETPLCAG